MRKTIIITSALALAGCSMVRADIANQAQASLVGMPKEKILACMGAPESKMAEGQTEVWSYGSGGSTVVSGNSSMSINAYGNTSYGSGFSSGTAVHRYCKVNVVFNSGSVSAVNYTGNTGGFITRGEQCAYAVQACLPQQPKS